MDPIVGTGSAAMMAIRILLDHDVDEDKIILVSLLMAECGSQGECSKNIHFGMLSNQIKIRLFQTTFFCSAISYVFPKVKIVTSMVDERFDFDSRKIMPGLGNFGDRYFGTC